jgi:hypothetical protein
MDIPVDVSLMLFQALNDLIIFFIKGHQFLPSDGVQLRQLVLDEGGLDLEIKIDLLGLEGELEGVGLAKGLGGLEVPAVREKGPLELGGEAGPDYFDLDAVEVVRELGEDVGQDGPLVRPLF